MSWDRIRLLQKDIIKGKFLLYIQQNQLMLYLNQMSPIYSNRLKMLQNLNVISFICFLVLIFIKWKLSLLTFLIFIITAIINPRKANEYIYKNSIEDIAFLKLALSVGLITLSIKK